MGCRRTDCLSRPLSKLFEKLGSTVGSFPLYFLIIPIVVSLALGGGFFFIKDREDNDLERQFTPKKGPSKVTRAFVKENFPYNDSMFSKDRLYNMGNFASLIAVSRNSSSVLESPAFEDILRLNDMILNLTVDNGSLGFNDLCAVVKGRCASNVILDIITHDRTRITYPEHVHGSSSVFLGSVLGGVLTDGNGTIQSAQAVKLLYYLDHHESKASELWLRGFKALLSEQTDIKHIDVGITSYLFFYSFILLLLK